VCERQRESKCYSDDDDGVVKRCDEKEIVGFI
jgi:hypothetical protein